MRFKVLLSLTLVLCAQSALQAETIRIVGSDLLLDALREPVEKLSAQQEDLTIDLDLNGSALARRDLISGEADIAMLAVPVGQTAPEQEFTVLPIGFKVATVVVNRSNPLTEISQTQLAAIYGTLQSESITQWGQLGMVGGWRNRNVNAQALRTLDGVSLELFRYTVLGQGELNRGKIGFWESADQLYLNLRNDDAAIAVIGTPYVPSGLKVVDITSPEGIAYGATDDAIFFGDYPLRLPFFIVYKEENEKRLQPLLAYLYSDEAAALFRKRNIVPIPDSERRERLLMINLAR